MIHLIIAHYAYHLDWIVGFRNYPNLNIIIYSKNENTPDKIHGIKVIKRLNAGREGETYINYIIENYNNLNPDDYTIFCQDDPIEHQPNFIKILRFFLDRNLSSMKLPLIQPLNSHAYQDVKQDMKNKNNIISGDIFSYDEYKQKKKDATRNGKIFMNNYPPKSLNAIKTHSIFKEKEEQLAQINIMYLNLELESVLLPDTNPFIWHLYKGIANYFELDGVNTLLKSKTCILMYLILIYSQSGIISETYLKRILKTKYLPYNPSAQFLIKNKLILDNDLYIYQNIQNILLDPSQPILPQQVRLNGFILEFLWLYLFQFEKYYKNLYTLPKLRFYKNKNGIKKDIEYYRHYVAFGLKKSIKAGTIIQPTKQLIKLAFQTSKKIVDLGKGTIEQMMKIMIQENENMKKNKSYPYYTKIT